MNNKSAFSVDAPEESPGFLLWQTTIVWQRIIKKMLEDYDISHAQFVLLAGLLWFDETEQEPIQAVIVEMTKLDKMTVSKSLKKLVVEGYVKRSEHAQDSRAKLVHLTKRGRVLARKLVPLVEQIDKEFFNVINKRDQQTFLCFLRQLADRL